MASLFTEDGNCIGFDGSQMNGRVVGMVPPGESDINPAVNAVQTLVAVKHKGYWCIEVFQNTPAAFHGRPELGEQLTEEMRKVLRTSSSDR